MQKTILVTGGAGFLGSHLCRSLLLSGQRVICLDNYSTGSAQNIEHLKKHEAFEVLEQDITSPIAIEMDEIFNQLVPPAQNNIKMIR